MYFIYVKACIFISYLTLSCSLAIEIVQTQAHPTKPTHKKNIQTKKQIKKTKQNKICVNTNTSLVLYRCEYECACVFIENDNLSKLGIVVV